MPEDKPKYTGRKRKARKIRKGQYLENEDGKRSSHVMEHGEDKGGYSVNPTIFPKKKNPSHKREDWEEKTGTKEAYNEAKKRGEVFYFRRKKAAEKFSAGSWKKGKDRREAMKDYREGKKKKKG